MSRFEGYIEMAFGLDVRQSQWPEGMRPTIRIRIPRGITALLTGRILNTTSDLVSLLGEAWECEGVALMRTRTVEEDGGTAASPPRPPSPCTSPREVGGTRGEDGNGTAQVGAGADLSDDTAGSLRLPPGEGAGATTADGETANGARTGVSVPRNDDGNGNGTAGGEGQA